MKIITVKYQRLKYDLKWTVWKDETGENVNKCGQTNVARITLSRQYKPGTDSMYN